MADFAAQREKSEEQRQERLKKKRSSSSSTTLSARQIRTRELQSQGLSTTEASQISLAESTGQKLTNIQTLSPEAQRIIRGSGLEATRSGSSRTSTTQTTSTSTTDKPTLQQQIREGREARVERQRSLAEQEAQKRFFDINTQTLFPDEPGRKRKVERPIFTEGTGRRLAGEELTLVEAPKRKVFKEEGTGLTIGVEDEISGQSFRTTATEKRLQEETIERGLEAQGIVKERLLDKQVEEQLKSRRIKQSEDYSPGKGVFGFLKSIETPFKTKSQKELISASPESKKFALDILSPLATSSTKESFILTESELESKRKQSNIVLGASVGTYAGLAIGSKIPASGRIIKSIGIPILMSTAAQKGTTFTGKYFLPSDLKQLSERDIVQEAIFAGRERAKIKFIEKEGLKGKVKTFIPTLFEGLQKQNIEDSLRTEFIKRGFKGKELQQGVEVGKRQIAFAGAGELAGLLAAGATTEKIGRNLFFKENLVKTSKGFRLVGKGKIATKIRAFNIIGPLGIGEGAAESISSQISEGKKISPLKVAGAGAFGGVFAGSVGSQIVTATGFKRARREVLANIVDVTELPGDLIASFSDIALRKAKRLPGDIAFKAKVKLATAAAVNPLTFASFITNPSAASAIAPLTNVPTRTKTSQNLGFSFDPTISAPSLSSKSNSFIRTSSQTPSTIPPTIPPTVPSTVPSTVPITVPSTVPSTVPATVPSTLPATLPATVPTTVPSTVPSTVPATVPVFVIDEMLPFFKKKRMKDGFNTQVKVKGKWKNINKKPQTEATAFDLANYVVDNSTARSFRVTKSKKKGKLSNKDYPGSFNPLNYRKKGNTYIEPASRAINSPGELQGITALGLLTKKKKKAQKDIFRIGF